MPPDASSQALHSTPPAGLSAPWTRPTPRSSRLIFTTALSARRRWLSSEPVTRALMSPAPAVEPPPELEAKTLASVQQAVLAARQAGLADDPKHTAVTESPASLLRPQSSI